MMIQASLCALLFAAPVWAEDAAPPVRAKAVPSPAVRSTAMLEKVPNGVLDALERQRNSKEGDRSVRISGDIGVRVSTGLK